MGLPKSKAQIAWRRYWVVCLLGGFGGWGGCLRGACWLCFLWFWSFLVLISLALL
jgi:hypothetical protein